MSTPSHHPRFACYGQKPPSKGHNLLKHLLAGPFPAFLRGSCRYTIYINRRKSLTPTTSYFLRMKAMDSDSSLLVGIPSCMPYGLSSGPPKRTGCSIKGNLSGPRAVLPYS
eukprot:TRINITY_DN43008_c0_g2_i2.p1 TRINITY_DN43008_c0_g2~~TRINITY_DN43008_c0_g2_i2.p1  ORF type:complete len:111 (+),score=12.59 TRINITY_DN43008_c0_g2_i2:2580-2912(+)